MQLQQMAPNPATAPTRDAATYWGCPASVPFILLGLSR
jgi:hypothetical protein